MSAAVPGGTGTNRKTNSVLKEKTEKDTEVNKTTWNSTKPIQYCNNRIKAKKS